MIGFPAEQVDKQKRDGSTDRNRCENVAQPMVIHSYPRDGNKDRENDKGNAELWKEKGNRKEQAPEVGGVSGGKRTAVSSEEVIVPGAAGEHLVRTQSMEDLFQHTSREPCGEMGAANKKKHPCDVTRPFPNEQHHPRDDEHKAQREFGPCHTEDDFENTRTGCQKF